jgi:hypothetical protein
MMLLSSEINVNYDICGNFSREIDVVKSVSAFPNPRCVVITPGIREEAHG